MSDRRCIAQTYWYENGLSRATYCPEVATRRTQGDAHGDEVCAEHARMAIEAGARDLGPIAAPDARHE